MTPQQAPLPRPDAGGYARVGYTRIRIDNRVMPGVESERTLTYGSELQRCAVYQDGTYVGEIVYVRRKLRNGGSDYGWRPAKASANVKLTSQVEAVRRLPNFSTAARVGPTRVATATPLAAVGHRCSQCPECGTPVPL